MQTMDTNAAALCLTFVGGAVLSLDARQYEKCKALWLLMDGCTGEVDCPLEASAACLNNFKQALDVPARVEHMPLENILDMCPVADYLQAEGVTDAIVEYVRQRSRYMSDPMIVTCSGHSAGHLDASLPLEAIGGATCFRPAQTLPFVNVHSIACFCGGFGGPESTVYIVAAVDPGVIRVLRLDDLSEVQRLNGHSRICKSVAVLSTNRTGVVHLVSVSMDRTVKIWNAETGDCVKTLYGHSEGVTQVVVLRPMQTVVSGSLDRTVRVWDIDAGTCLQHLKLGLLLPSSLATLPNGRVAVGFFLGGIAVWTPDSNDIKLLDVSPNYITCVTVLNSERLVSSSSDGVVQLWDMSTFECVATVELPGKQCDCVCGLPDGRIICGSSDSICVVCPDPSGGGWGSESATKLQGAVCVSSVVCLPDGSAVAAAVSGPTYKLDVPAAQLTRLRALTEARVPQWCIAAALR